MLRRMLKHLTGEQSACVALPRQSPETSNFWLFFSIGTTFVATLLLSGSYTLTAILTVLLAAIVFGLRAVFRCGGFRRSVQSELLKTTPTQQIDCYLPAVTAEIRSVLVLGFFLLAGVVIFAAVSLGPVGYFWTVPLLAFWAHAVLFMAGVTMTAGAIGMYRDTLLGCTVAPLISCAIHIAIAIISHFAACLVVLVLLWLGLCNAFDASPYLLPPLLVPPLTLIGPWFALRIGPNIVRRRRTTHA